MRTQFQGVANVVRFNWPFYAAAVGVAGLALATFSFLPLPFAILAMIASLVGLGGISVSLFVSWWIYDRSELYSMPWLDEIETPNCIVNINAGFDEVSPILRDRYPCSEFHVWDFFDERQHTEPSIRRARKSYPPDVGIELVSASSLPMQDDAADMVCVFMAAHEIRDADDQVMFFREIRRILRSRGRVFVTEHLRDLPNALAYSVGVLHFRSRRTWLGAFEQAGLAIVAEHKATAFVSTFVCDKP